jgi:hypothetical protein
MFNFSEWVVAGIIDGFNKGLTAFSKVTELTANYLTKGIITQEQAENIANACPNPALESEE